MADGGDHFSTQWLALREPADIRARKTPEVAAMMARLAGHLPGDGVRIADLGSGTGASLRALAPLLPGPQAWFLHDHDARLLQAARMALLADGGGTAERPGSTADREEIKGGAKAAAKGGLIHHPGGISPPPAPMDPSPSMADESPSLDTAIAPSGAGRLTVSFIEADLAAHPEIVFARKPHLVTASAFFDLVSAAYMERLSTLLGEAGAIFHTTLICDGRDGWHPPHPLDEEVAQAFRLHQGRDKGFGPAAGPQAGAVLAQALERKGFEVIVARTPWRLSRPADGPLMAALAEGTARAAGETRRLDPVALARWQAARQGAETCEIGHLDLLALPARH